MSSVFKGNRKRVFPHHIDAYQYYPDYRAVENLYDSITESGADSGVQALEKYGNLRESAPLAELFHRMQNSFNDPICVYYVLDALVQCERGIYIRPQYIVAQLQQHVRQFYWTLGVVGRILAGLNNLAYSCYIEPGVDSNEVHIDDPKEQGETKEHYIERLRRRLPIAQGRDAQGRFYVIDPQGGNEGLLWLAQMRKVWLDMARQSMEDDDRGHMGENWGDSQAPVDYFLEHFDEAARPPRSFNAQLAGEATFQAYKPTRLKPRA